MENGKTDTTGKMRVRLRLKSQQKTRDTQLKHTFAFCISREQKMRNVQSIAKAVEALPPSELAEFRHWFGEFDSAAWDRQIEQDAAAGKLDALAAEALADFESGFAREL